MTLELPQILSAIAILLSAYTIIRSGWQSRQGTDEGLRVKLEADIKSIRQIMDAQEQLWRSRFDAHHDKLIVMEAKLTPLFTVFDKRLAEMLHQPHDEAYNVDQLLDKYQEDPGSLSDTEYNRLIYYIYQRYERLKTSTAAADQTMALAATMYLAILDGQRATRQVLREQVAREQVAVQQREELLQYLREAKASFDVRESWWARLKQFLRGSR